MEDIKTPTATNKNTSKGRKGISDLLGEKAEYLLNHQSKTISKDQLHLPGPDFIDRIWINQRPQPPGTA